jgi:fatty acid desaturase
MSPEATDRVEAPAAGNLAALRRRTLRGREGFVNVSFLLGCHAVLLAWFWLGFALLPWYVYVPVSLFVCVVHQKAMSEWLHEGAHRSLVPDPGWNDRLGNALAGVWFMLPMSVYRASHFAHHRTPAFFTGTDPETTFLEVRSRRAFRRAIVEDLTGITIIRQYARFRASQNDGDAGLGLRLAFLVTLLAVVAFAFWIGRWDVVVLYYGTLVTLYPLLNRLRTYGQHVRIETDGEVRLAGSTVSRTIDAGWWDRLLWTSPRLLYHYEHHHHPFLPYRALPTICTHASDENEYTTRRIGTLRAMYRGLPTRDPAGSSVNPGRHDDRSERKNER